MKKAIFFLIASMFSLVSFAAETSKSAEAKAESAAVTSNVASSFVVKGRVLDADAQSLAGATITVAGKKVYTDLDGNFSVVLSNNTNCQLKASMISFEEQTLEVNPSSSNLVIRLKQ
ncbi:MAG: carboxypeptidase-like regulatory domain-containing protein [Bacteroidales bacterium]